MKFFKENKFKILFIIFDIVLIVAALVIRSHVIAGRMPVLTLNQESVELSPGVPLNPLDYIDTCRNWNGDDLKSEKYVSCTDINTKKPGKYDVVITVTNEYNNKDEKHLKVKVRSPEEELARYPSLNAVIGQVYRGMGDEEKTKKEFLLSDFQGVPLTAKREAFEYGYDSNQCFVLKNKYEEKDKTFLGFTCIFLTEEEAAKEVEKSGSPIIDEYQFADGHTEKFENKE